MPATALATPAEAPPVHVPTLAEQAAIPVVAIGQPDRMILSWGPVGGYDFERDETTARLYGDLTLKGPLGGFGIGDVTLEAACGRSGRAFETALGVHLKLPWLRGGYEYDVRDDRLVPVFSAEIALARGGLLKRGDELRIEVRPWQEEVMVGFDFTRPFRRYRMTRPATDHARLPSGRIPDPPAAPLPDGIETCLARVRHAVLWLDRLLTPAFAPGDELGEEAAAYRDHIRRPGHDFAAEDSVYHRELRRSLVLAAEGDETCGEALARAAEALILREVVLPWNRLFGRNKSPHHLGGYAERALARFDGILDEDPALARLAAPAVARARAREVLRRTLAAIDEAARAGRGRWRLRHVPWLKESRLVWLPLNYGLRPEERDSREDWQRILTDLSGVPFTRGNTIEYLVNEQFHRALLRTIQATRRHHVTVIHDFRGRDADGDGDDDTIGWEVAIDGYLAALTAAVADLDRGGRDRLPEFHLFLDENYYQVNDSRPLMTFLENPWERDPPRLRDAALAARAEAAVAALRRAVRASAACRALPKDALRELLRVHVHVTNPYDPVFASDATMRDHRKLAFRDVDEGDPAAGEAILTGLGVGEKYNGTAWEDRSLLVRGEALVALKDAARELFRSQGYDADEVPPCLRAGPAGAGPPGVPGDWTVPVQLSRNLTGYGKKAATAVKAALYNLLPAGGVLLVPDSLWLSEFWAGMLVGAAARGVDVLVMAPAPENAPSAGMVTLHLLRENLEMMIRAAALLAGDLERAGGSLRVGCYAEDRPVQDLAGRLRTLAGELATHPELAAALSLPPAALAAADSLARLWEPEGVPPPLAPDRARLAAHHPPFLHLKAQLLLGPGARRALAGTDWPALLADYFTVRHAQLRGRDARGIAPALVPDGLDDELPALLLLGSHNQDRRSMLLDGEALATVAGPAALLAAPDLAYLAAATVWARTPAELAAVFPEVDGPGFLKKWFRLLRDLI